MSDKTTAYPGLIVRCEDSEIYFKGIVDAALCQIAGGPIGNSLLQNIANLASKAQGGFTIAITKPKTTGKVELEDGVFCYTNTWTNKAVRFNEANACSRGVGTRSGVFWNPNLLSSPDGGRPPYIALAHELIHAYQNLKGTAYAETLKEEYCTVGLGEYKKKRKHTENKIRAENGIAIRTKYSGLENV